MSALNPEAKVSAAQESGLQNHSTFFQDAVLGLLDGFQFISVAEAPTSGAEVDSDYTPSFHPAQPDAIHLRYGENEDHSFCC